MDNDLSGQHDIDWDGFINFPQTPDLTAQSPFDLDEPKCGSSGYQELAKLDENALFGVDDSYR